MHKGQRSSPACCKPETFVDDEDLEEIKSQSRETYGLLCQVAPGRQWRSSKTPGLPGFLAWQWMHGRYNPRAMARAIRLISEVPNPGKEGQAPQVCGHGADGLGGQPESARCQLDFDREVDERLSNRVMIAVIASLLLTMVQDLVNGQLGEGEWAYSELPAEASGGVGRNSRWLYGTRHAASAWQAD